jgi:rhodanese-related sulfurtransferase
LLIFIPRFVEFCIATSSALVAMGLFRAKERRELEERFITPQELHTLMSRRKVLLFDLREPLDLLGRSEIITGAKWIAPEAVIKNPSLIPQDQDSVIYCTCPSDETGRKLMRRALAMHFSRMKLLRGGLDAWIASGYQTVPYSQAFRLNTGK